MSADQKNESLSPEDALLIKRVSAHYVPSAMTSPQRLAFDRALEERLATRPHKILLRPAAVVASACAVVLVWFILGQQGRHQLNEGQSREVAGMQEEDDIAIEDVNLLTYAYYSQDFDEDDTDEEKDDSFLPDEYEEFDNAIVNPDA